MDRKQMNGNLPADYAELASDRSCFEPDEVEAAPAPIPDDMVSRLQVIEALDRMIAERNRMINPASAFWLTDTGVLSMLNVVREAVIDLEGE